MQRGKDRRSNMKIYNLQDKLEFLDEIANLEYEEWASNKEENRQARIERKKKKFVVCFLINHFVN